MEAAGLPLGRWAGRVRGKSQPHPWGEASLLSCPGGEGRSAGDARATRPSPDGRRARALRALRRRLRAFPDPDLVPLQAPRIGSVSIFISQRGNEAGR